MSETRLPTLETLGRDLLKLSRGRVLLALISPPAWIAAFAILASREFWPPAIGCIAVLSFITYGSVSHDLVHRSLGLNRRLNDLLLSAIELLMFRSGRAYRLVHLNHHASFPDRETDPEARAAHGSWWAALARGPTFFIRLWWWAVLHHPHHRARLLIEGGLIAGMLAATIVLAAGEVTVIPLVFVATVHVGGWFVPLATAYIPHTPAGPSVLQHTRRFRGYVARVLALDHLYHLEHHLYPSVPHQRWPELARRLDPVLDRAGVPAIRLVI